MSLRYTICISIARQKHFIKMRVQPECGVGKSENDVQNGKTEGRDSRTGIQWGQQTDP